MKRIQQNASFKLPQIGAQTVYIQRRPTAVSWVLAVASILTGILLIYLGQGQELSLTFHTLTLLPFLIAAVYLLGYKKTLIIDMDRGLIVQQWDVFVPVRNSQTELSSMDRVLCYKYRLRGADGASSPPHTMLCLGRLESWQPFQPLQQNHPERHHQYGA